MAYYIDESYRLKRMARLVAGCTTVIDIGYAQLFNPYLCNPCVVGVDVAESPRVSGYTDTFRGTLADYMATAGAKQPDAIVAGELLEHLEDPLTFLREVRATLPPRGLFVLSTPNPNSPIEHLLTITLSRKYYFTSEHLFVFPQRWLVRILEYAGFVKPVLYSGGFPLPWYGLAPFPRPWCYQTIAVCRVP